jgi:hypothetical protein
VHELAHSAGVHTCHTRLHEPGASAGDMAQHLVQLIPPSHSSHIQEQTSFRELGKVPG